MSVAAGRADASSHGWKFGGGGHRLYIPHGQDGTPNPIGAAFVVDDGLGAEFGEAKESRSA